MRGVLWLAGTAVGSLAFQASVAIWPQRLAQYAWLVKYFWMAWFVFMLSWLITHERVLGRKLKRLWGVEDDLPRVPPIPTPVLPPSVTENKSESNPKQELHQTGVTVETHIHGIGRDPVPLKPPTEKFKERITNVQCLGPKATYISAVPDRNGTMKFHTSPGKTHLSALIVCFRNNAVYGKDIGPILKATVHLKFFNEHGDEIGNGISGCYWIDENSDMFDLTPGGPSGCIILLISHNLIENNSFMVPWFRYTTGSWMGPGLVQDEFILQGLPHKIELSLLDNRDRLVLPTIIVEEISLKDGVFSAVTKQHPAP